MPALVILNSLLFIFFAFSFFKPKSKRDWRAFGAFSAFIVALFVEMYGFPLTIYFLSGWLGQRYPQLNLMSHDAGQLLQTLIGWKGSTHFNPIHLTSDFFIIVGFFLFSKSWHVLYQAQCDHRLATTGPYTKIRHPHYAAFVLIMFGFLIQWPTLVTLAMFPILVIAYARLAKKEERDVEYYGIRYWEDGYFKAPIVLSQGTGMMKMMGGSGMNMMDMMKMMHGQGKTDCPMMKDGMMNGNEPAVPRASTPNAAPVTPPTDD